MASRRYGLGAIAILFIVLLGYAIYYPFAPLTNDVVNVIIPKNSGFQKSVAILQDADVVTPLQFKILAVVTGSARDFKAGEYEIPPGTTPLQLIYMLRKGDVVIRKVTIPEGSTNKEIFAQLMALPAVTGEIPPGIKEGSLLPETYHYTFGDTRAELIARMQKDMEKLLGELWARRAQPFPLPSKEAALTLASIVEEETGRGSERAMVAGVFFNRLRTGMKLQSDPTILYGLGRGAKNDDRRITRTDIGSQTPYNTYVIDGLPPGPICNPGKASLVSVFQPAPTDAIFFVADGTGGHRFANNLKEHEENVRVWRAGQ